MKPVLVVGGTSFIGRHLLPRLVADGRSVVATCRRPDDRLEAADVQWVTSDLAGPDPAVGWPAECDTVVFLAQSRAWRQVPDGARDVFDVNVSGVFRAAEYARTAGARFILASSGSVYSGDGPHRECDAIDVGAGRTFYAASKLCAEVLLGSYASSMPVIVLRLFVPYGEHQDPLMLIPQVVRKVRSGDPVMLQGDDGLRANPVAVCDVADALVRCLSLTRSVTMNVAGPEVLTLRQIAMTIGELVDRGPRFAQQPDAVRTVVGDTSVLGDALQWRPRTSLREGLAGWLTPA